jgi:hypothetical protein
MGDDAVRATSGEGGEEKDGDIHVSVVGPNEVVRAALKWQVLLTDAVHPDKLLGK